MKVRSIIMAEGKYLNLPDMLRALTDHLFIKEKLLPILKVGGDRGDSPEKIVSVCVGAALGEWSGELPRQGRSWPPVEDKKPLTQKELNDACCDCGECDGVLFFHGRCHPKAATLVSYRKDGLLMINCAECSSMVAVIAVDRKL